MSGAENLRELIRLDECLPTIETMCGKNAGAAIRDAAALIRKQAEELAYLRIRLSDITGAAHGYMQELQAVKVELAFLTRTTDKGDGNG